MATVLDGIRVAAFTHFAAGPIAAQYLGAFGADVIKVESPQQDVNRYALRHPDGLLQGISPYFLVTNRNQRCLGLDLKNPAGLEVAKQLISTSDIVIENYRPDVMEKLGLGYANAKALKPDVIYCSLSAYDSEGPGRGRPGQDLLMQVLSGGCFNQFHLSPSRFGTSMDLRRCRAWPACSARCVTATALAKASGYART
jgi:crotonobetainyl-CoA:carnitine CoA-transferase CaiB-like acyl-CoA transferase